MKKIMILIYANVIYLAFGYSQNMVLIEAESFIDYGGWTLDAQFIDQMGSSYLMAHGLGTPVKNARTTVKLSSSGNYKIFVRTMNWVPGYEPGKFKLKVDGKVLSSAFGIGDNREWKWYPGGTINFRKLESTIELIDITGFNGRIDALLLVKDSNKNFTPPNDLAQLTSLRNSLLGIDENFIDAGKFDLVVIGGGFSGICAAVAAARLNLKVALIQNRSVLGGNASSEVRVNPIGRTDYPPYPRNADIVKELLDTVGQRTYSQLAHIDDKRLEVVTREKNITLFLDTHANQVSMNGNRIASVNAINVRTNRKYKFEAPLFVDCTGDGTIGYLAGAEFRMGREARGEFNELLAPLNADSMVMGNTQYWYAVEKKEKSSFPFCPWALPIENEAMYQVPVPKWPMKLVPGIIATSAWNWESGFYKNPIDDAEYIRDHNLRAIFGVWNFLKNKSPEKEKYALGELIWVAHVVGKRESRRLIGDVILTQNDIMEQKPFEDGCVTTTWYFDLHFPHPENSKYFPGEEFRSIAYDDPNWELYGDQFPGEYIKVNPYPIPFRTLYSKNIHNLMMAGRNISVSHAALATTRVMLTCGMMGTVVGRAAYILKKFDDEPASIYTKHLEEFRELLKNPDTMVESNIEINK